MSESPITPEKLREEVKRLATYAVSKQPGPLRSALSVALNQMMAAADEIERLQRKPVYISASDIFLAECGAPEDFMKAMNRKRE